MFIVLLHLFIIMNITISHYLNNHYKIWVRAWFNQVRSEVKKLSLLEKKRGATLPACSFIIF